MTTTQRSGSMLEEWPYAYVVNSDKAANYCAFCLKKSEASLQRCSRCRLTHFCNEACQRAAWTEHRDECTSLANVRPRIPTALARLMARIIFKRRDHPSTDPPPTTFNNRRFEDLMNHRKEITEDPERSEHFVALCHVLREYVGIDQL
uniref:MYND-type domain-containing protein n=1 Tax=Plectus sambesii TaxID=2011161 RepID=A0A914UPF5_9BILA